MCLRVNETIARAYFNLFVRLAGVSFLMLNGHRCIDGCRFNEISFMFALFLIEVALSRITLFLHHTRWLFEGTKSKVHIRYHHPHNMTVLCSVRPIIELK